MREEARRVGRGEEPEEMARARPDLLTGELKLPAKD